MRGGAIPLLVWSLLNLILLIIAAIFEWGTGWHNVGLHLTLTGFTVVVLWAGGALLLTRTRRSISKGPPEYTPRPEPLPRVSFGASGFGLGIGLAAFGVVFGKFLIFLGAAVFLLSLGRLSRELLWQRYTMRDVERRRRA